MLSDDFPIALIMEELLEWEKPKEKEKQEQEEQDTNWERLKK